MDPGATWDVDRLSPVERWPDNVLLGTSDIPWTVTMVSDLWWDLRKMLTHTHLGTISEFLRIVGID